MVGALVVGAGDGAIVGAIVGDGVGLIVGAAVELGDANIGVAVGARSGEAGPLFGSSFSGDRDGFLVEDWLEPICKMCMRDT